MNGTALTPLGKPINAEDAVRMARPGTANSVFWDGDDLIIPQGPHSLVCRKLPIDEVPEPLAAMAARVNFLAARAWVLRGGGRQEVWLFSALGNGLCLALDDAAVSRATALVAAATPRELVGATA